MPAEKCIRIKVRCPINRHQLLAVASGSILAMVFYLLVHPNVPKSYTRASVLVHFPALFTSAICFILCSTTDQSLTQGRKTIPAEAVTATCAACNAVVTGSSKHCFACNRCVAQTARHCKWVNNCIGKRNHCWYLGMICWLDVAAAVHLAGAVLVLWKVTVDQHHRSQILGAYDIRDQGYCFLLVVVASAAASLLVLLGSGLLVLLAVCTRVKGLLRIAPGHTEGKQQRHSAGLRSDVPMQDYDNHFKGCRAHRYIVRRHQSVAADICDEADKTASQSIVISRDGVDCSVK